ncbi:hypothetical protein acdb102_45850 [Acidothermaceae bacterium B102]|nr:hypothetical protein acdb102_45850 [Acidothermaceae bacterium B102]
MELSVRPDDLVTSAAALRRVHDEFSRACDDFGSLGARLAPALGPHAAETARSAVQASAAATGSVQDDLATFARGLSAAAAYYSAIDRHALGSVRP